MGDLGDPDRPLAGDGIAARIGQVFRHETHPGRHRNGRFAAFQRHGRAGIPAQGVRRHEQEAELLGVEALRFGQINTDLFGQTDDALGLAGLCGQGQDTGQVTPRRLVVIARIVKAQRGLGRIKGAGGPGPVADQVERCAQLRESQRALDPRQALVMHVAQARAVHPAGTGQHIKRISDRTVRQAFRRVGLALPAIDIRGIARRPPQLTRRDVLHRDEGPVQRHLRHGVAGLAGPREEVDRIGPDPGLGLTVTHTPQTDNAIIGLTAEQGSDGLLHLRPALRRRLAAGNIRQGPGIQQRQGPAGDLFGTAIRIAIQRFQHGIAVQRNGREIHRDHGIARQISGQCCGIQRPGPARIQTTPGDLRRSQPGRTDLDRITALGSKTARALDGQGDRADARVRAGNLVAPVNALAPGQLDLVTRVEIDRIFRPQNDVIGPRFAIHIVDGEGCGGDVSRRQEARQDEFGRHIIAYGQRLGSMADGPATPGHRHQAQLAIEVRHVQRDRGPAVAAHGNRSREQRNCPRRHDGQTGTADLVTPLADGGCRTLVGIEQAAIIIEQINIQCCLAEIPGIGIGRGKAGQRENALIHRRNGHPGTGTHRAIDLQLQRHLLARMDALGGVEIDVQRAVRGVHRQMDDPHGPARCRTVDRIARRVDRHHGIGPGAPVLGHPKIQLGAALGQAHQTRFQHPVGGNHDLGLAGIGRQYGQRGRITDRDRSVGTGNRHPVRCFGARLGGTAPADPEGRAGAGAGLGIAQHQLVIAPVQRPQGQRLGPLARQGQNAGLDRHHMTRPAPLPAPAIAAVPVIIPVDPHQAPVQLGRHRLAFRAQGHNVEGTGPIALGPAFKMRAGADIARCRAIGDAHIIGDRAPTRLNRRNHGAHTQGLGRILPYPLGIDLLQRPTGSVRRGIRQVQRAVAERLVMASKGEASIVGKRRRVGLHPQASLHRQSGTRRAVEEADIGFHGPGLPGQQWR